MIGIDIEMPKNCQECPCLKYGEYGAFEKSSCSINHKIVISNKKRPIECPLVELKGFKSKCVFSESVYRNKED